MEETVSCANKISVPTMVTISKASEITGVSYDYLRKLCMNKKIVHIRAGKKYLINLEKLGEYLNSNIG